MHFYPFNIGDYATATAHLEPLEDLAYRRLLDLYYSTEKPVPLDLNKIARLIRMRTHSDCIAIVLEEFFTEEDDGFHCDRIDVELFKFHEKSDKASKSAKARWKKTKKKQKVTAPCERIANAVETQCEGNAKQELRNKKQETRNTPIVSRFDEFWDMYGKKDSRSKCEPKFNKLPESVKHKIFEVLPAYIESTPDKKYRKNPFTWLNGKCWEDDIAKVDYVDFDLILNKFNEYMPEKSIDDIAPYRMEVIRNTIKNAGIDTETLIAHFENAAFNQNGLWQQWRYGNTDASGRYWEPKGFDFYISLEAFSKSTGR